MQHLNLTALIAAEMLSVTHKIVKQDSVVIEIALQCKKQRTKMLLDIGIERRFIYVNRSTLHNN